MIPDEAPVSEDMSLYRRVHPKEIVWNENDRCLRPGSGVFKDREMSIHLHDVLKDEEREPESVLDGKPHHSLVALTAGFVKGEEQAVDALQYPRTPRTARSVATRARPAGRASRERRSSSCSVRML